MKQLELMNLYPIQEVIEVLELGLAATSDLLETARRNQSNIDPDVMESLGYTKDGKGYVLSAFWDTENAIRVSCHSITSVPYRTGHRQLLKCSL